MAYDDMAPVRGRFISVSVTATASASTVLPNEGTKLTLVNRGTNPCYVSVGVGSQTATVPSSTAAETCRPVLAGAEIELALPRTDVPLQISAICEAAQTTTLFVSVWR